MDHCMFCGSHCSDFKRVYVLKASMPNREKRDNKNETIFGPYCEKDVLNVKRMVENMYAWRKR